MLLGEFWDPSSGAVFAEEGDQQRFWKLTRRFVEGLGEEGSPYAGRIKAVRACPSLLSALWLRGFPSFSVFSDSILNHFILESTLEVVSSYRGHGMSASSVGNQTWARWSNSWVHTRSHETPSQTLSPKP